MRRAVLLANPKSITIAGQLMPAQFAPQGQPTCESMPERCGLRDNACHAKEGEPDFGGEWRDDMDWDNFCPSGEYRQGMAVSSTALVGWPILGLRGERVL